MYVQSASLVYFLMIFIFSCNMKLNLDYMIDVVWEYLALMRVYTKRKGGMYGIGGVWKQQYIMQLSSSLLLSNQ